MRRACVILALVGPLLVGCGPNRHHQLAVASQVVASSIFAVQDGVDAAFLAQRITPAQLISEGRVYGGGLHKVEPKELAHISARLVLDSIATHVRIEHQVPMLFT